jgi:hypothetical protein
MHGTRQVEIKMRMWQVGNDPVLPDRQVSVLHSHDPAGVPNVMGRGRFALGRVEPAAGHRRRNSHEEAGEPPPCRGTLGKAGCG